MSNKKESLLIEKINNAVDKAATGGVFHVGITLLKSNNTWTFSGHPMLVDALSAHAEVILPTLEEASRNIPTELLEMVDLGDSEYRTPTLLPPMPAPLSNLALTTTRSYVAKSLTILTGVRNSRLLYKQERPSWWPEEIPFAKPGHVPDSLTKEFGSSASNEWHLRLRRIVYEMYRHVHQDFRRNVDPEGWHSFQKKYENKQTNEH